MDLEKFKIWKSGLTDADREAIAKQESAEAVFKNEIAKVSATVNTEGFQIILDKIIAITESKLLELRRCKKKDLTRLQDQIEIRTEFINSFNTYLNQ